MANPSLHIVCPHCASRIDVLQAVADGELREYLDILAGFGPAARPAVEGYLELFRALPSRCMRIATRLRLARQLRNLWDSGLFEFAGHTHRAMREQITEALHRVVRAKANGAGFANHNYLKQVLIGRLDQVDRQERRQGAKEERDREKNLRAGRREIPAPMPPSVDETVSPEEAAVMLLDCYQHPRRREYMGGMMDIWEGILAQAGVDVSRLKALAAALDPEKDRPSGAELVRRCRRDNAPAPVGECLTEMPGGRDEER